MGRTNTARMQVDLNGDWEKIVHGRSVEVVSVPSSLRPSGAYSLRRNFLLPRLAGGQRASVHFEGIAYYGRVFVNGKDLGSTIPYLPHDFEFTANAVEGSNVVAVEIADDHAFPDGRGKDEVEFGNGPGWEAYGGIIRDVSIELRPATYIENVRVGYRLSDGFRSAAIRAEVFLSSAASQAGTCDVSLLWGGAKVAQSSKEARLQPGSSSVVVDFDLMSPALWSPRDPNLYELQVDWRSGPIEDRWSCHTGFREFKTEGTSFMLNGERVVLNGVCRHDLWKDQGFTLSAAQRERDLRMIKAMGCNFVRLVHYPHDRKVIELANTLGLMVSEEPGFWNMNFEKLPPGVIDIGCSILEGTIRRDWNAPAVVIWLLGNECAFPLSYLKRGKEICDRNDPIRRLVSVAHLYGKFPEVKDTFDQAGLDFYDWHAYEFESGKFARLAQEFGPGKPLTLTEWGWEDAGDGDIFYERDFDGLLEQVETEKIAGHSFWSWNDMRQYTRIDWPTQNGILLSGAVTEAREIREPIYSRLAGLFAGRRENCGAPVPGKLEILPLRSIPFHPGSEFHCVDLQPLADSPEAAQSWKALEQSMAAFWPGSMAKNQWQRTGSRFDLWRESTVGIAGVEFRFPLHGGLVRPLVLTAPVPEITIPVHRRCSTIHILGQVSLPEGYPLTGVLGEECAVYTLQFAQGKPQVFPVRHGIEAAQANCIYQATRIAPVATGAQPALFYRKDEVREQYQILLLSIPVEPAHSGELIGMHCALHGQQPPLAIFAITVELGRQNPRQE